MMPSFEMITVGIKYLKRVVKLLGGTPVDFTGCGIAQEGEQV